MGDVLGAFPVKTGSNFLVGMHFKRRVSRTSLPNWVDSVRPNLDFAGGWRSRYLESPVLDGVDEREKLSTNRFECLQPQISHARCLFAALLALGASAAPATAFTSPNMGLSPLGTPPNVYPLCPQTEAKLTQRRATNVCLNSRNCLETSSTIAFAKHWLVDKGKGQHQPEMGTDICPLDSSHGFG